MTAKPVLTNEANTAAQKASISSLRRRVDRLVGMKDEKQRRQAKVMGQLNELTSYLELAQPVTEALKSLSDQLFQQELSLVQEKLTIALHDVLEQPVCFRATPSFRNGSAVVDFSIERNGNTEDVQRGQGGSVQNILSVGLRMFALATLGKANHRGFLVLDEQDCWLRPELVPKLVKIVRDAGRELGFQVLMISHHDLSHFERYAEKIIRLEPAGDLVRVTSADKSPLKPGEQI